MGTLALIAYWALEIYFYALVGRLILDLLISIRPGFRPKGLLLPVAEIIFTVTDPPLRFLRRFIKPVSFGAISLDFAWTLLVFGVIVLRNLVESLV
jgi:YggT family protein